MTARPHTHIRKASEISSSCEILRTPSTGGSAPVTFPQRPFVTSPLISKNGDHQGDQPYPNGHYRQPTTLVPSQRSNRLAVDAMLNATPNLTRTDRNPSRVVVCDSENRQFGQPPPDRLYPLPVNRPFLSDEMPLQHNVNGHGCPAAQYQQQNLRQQPLSAPSRMPFMMDERQASTANSQDTSFVPQRIHHTYQPAHTESSASRGIAQPSRMSRTIVAPAMNSTLPNASAPQPQSRDVQSAPLSVASGVGKIDPGVARMRAIMSALPPLRVPAIHLAGTNGKGSVSAILESCLRAAGLRTARYNSPHLLEPRDAVRFNGMPPTPEEYAMATQHIQAISDYHELRATTFEIATAAAYHLINQRQPDVMIIECGLGGAGDATNVIPADVTLASALTSIGLDHTAFLGTSIAAITEQKANIAVSGGFLFVAPQTHPDALAMARRVSSERGANLLEVQPSTEISQNGKGKMVLRPFEIPAATLVDTPLPINPAFNTGPMPHIITNLSLPGAHQLDNVSLALTILHVLRQDRRALAIQPKLAQISNLALETGVSSARWSGRCSWVQWVDPNTQQPFPILVDGSHNEDSARRLREYIDSLVIEPSRQVKFVVSLSSSQGKTVDSVLAPLLRPGDSVAAVYFSTPVEGMPWVSPVHKEAVRDVAKSLVGEAGEVWVGNGSGPQAVQGALRWATADWDEKGPGLVVICGSLYLVADAYRLIRP